MNLTVTQTVDLDETTLAGTPAEVGEWMADAALRVWYGYDDDETFRSKVVGRDNPNGPTIYHLDDPDMDVAKTFTALQFFQMHAKLIWLGTIDNYRHDWLNFAFRSSGANADEYDDLTVDAVLQNMLYGKIVYG